MQCSVGQKILSNITAFIGIYINGYLFLDVVHSFQSRSKCLDKDQIYSTLCLLCTFACFLWSAIFSKSTFSKNSFRNTISMSNSLDPDQARRFVGPGLGPNGLHRLSADDTSK